MLPCFIYIAKFWVNSDAYQGCISNCIDHQHYFLYFKNIWCSSLLNGTRACSQRGECGHDSTCNWKCRWRTTGLHRGRRTSALVFHQSFFTSTVQNSSTNVWLSEESVQEKSVRRWRSGQQVLIWMRNFKYLTRIAKEAGSESRTRWIEQM